MADAPPEPRFLLAGHAAPAFLEGGYIEGVGQRNRRSRRRFEEDLMGYATVFVFVTPSLTDTLIDVSLGPCSAK